MDEQIRGLLAQVILGRGIAAAGIAIDPAVFVAN